MSAVRVSHLIIPAFHALWRDVRRHGHSEYWMEGGRGSTKSSFISLAIVLLVLRNPYANACVVRRFSNTLRDSVYQQMLWAIDVLGVSSYFKASVSPMEITYLPTGQRIVFRGMDDPLKLKGVKFSTGYCAVTWFEELDQMDGWEPVHSALNSLRRGGAKFWTFYSYNPPRVAWSWVNEKRIEMQSKAGCLVNHSTYLDVVEGGHADWLGQPFVDEAEYVREADPMGYRWEYLGEMTGTGGSVFENIVERTITDEEMRGYGNPHCGVDWGWFPDPWRFVKCEWQPSHRRLIVWGELSATKTVPEDTAAMVRKFQTYPDAEDGRAVFHDDAIWCDSAGETEIATWRRKCGLSARSAPKGNMRKASYRWLSQLREIVIDPKHCPLTYRELKLCEYAKDREGRWIDDYDDGNDHSIDAIRYAMMRDIRRAA